jgi:hypothetical protein
MNWTLFAFRTHQAFLGDFRLVVEKFDVGARWRIHDTSGKLRCRSTMGVRQSSCDMMICEVTAENVHQAKRQAEIMARALITLQYHLPKQEQLFADADPTPIPD